MSEPFYCLFYSYKGGVGRTSAMMNVAKYLIKRKKKVMLLDFDLPAPGIDIFDVADRDSAIYPSYNAAKYFRYKNQEQEKKKANEADEKEKATEKLGIESWDELSDYVKDKKIPVPKGFVEFAKQYLEEIEKNDTDLDKLPKLIEPGRVEVDIADAIDDCQPNPHFVYKVPRESLDEGDMLMMRAGVHELTEQYAEDLKYVTAHWNKLIGNNTGQDKYKGHAEAEFIEYFRHQVRQLDVDYVLVDCKPGMDSLIETAIEWFAQSSVLVFNLNSWNMAGIVEGYKRITESYYQDKSLNVLLLASQIPPHATNNKLYANQYKFISEKMADARNASSDGGEGNPVEVPIADILMLRDVLISDIAPDDLACFRYKQLADLMIKGNGQDIDNNIRQALAEVEPDKVRRAFELLFREYKGNIALTLAYATYLLTLGEAQLAIEKLKEVLDLIKQSLGGQTEVDQNAISPYKRDAVYQFARAVAMSARQSLDDYLINRKDTVKAELKRMLDTSINTAINDIDGIIKLGKKDTDENTQKDDQDKENANYHYVLAQLYHLKGMIFKSLNESNRDAIRKELDKALVYINKSTKSKPKVVEFAHEKASITWRLNSLSQREIMNDNDEGNDVETVLQSVLKYRSDLPEVLITLGHYKLCRAIHVQQQQMPPLLPYAPWIDWPNAIVKDAVRNCKSDVDYKADKKALLSALDYLQRAERHRGHDPMVHYLMGWLEMLCVLNYEVGTIHWLSTIKKSISHFEKVIIYDPMFTPVYFYLGLLRFLLWELEDGKAKKNNSQREKERSEIYSRQSFYQLEHFIDKEWLAIVTSSEKGQLDEMKKEKPKAFYFDEEDIDGILESPFQFLIALESAMGFVPVVSLFKPKEKYNIEVAKEFVGMIDSYGKTNAAKKAKKKAEDADDN